MIIKIPLKNLSINAGFVIARLDRAIQIILKAGMTISYINSSLMKKLLIPLY